MNNKVERLSVLLAVSLFIVAAPVLAQDEPPPGPPPGGGPMDMKFPPPMPKSGSRENDAPPGTAAPDGIGVTVSRSPTAGSYDTDTVTYVPWEDISEVQPLAVGASLPDSLVAYTANGDPFDLNAAVGQQPTVLMYYRGGWCPFCNAHLRQLQGSVSELEEMGYQLLAISTDTVAALKSYEDETEFDYLLLADPELAVATELGLKYKLVQQYIDHVAESRVDLAVQNGGYLVTPAAYILDTSGVIHFAYANNNYTVRVSQEALLEAARAALDD